MRKGKMDNTVPDFTKQEWEFMDDYRKNSDKKPRENLIELISHIDSSFAMQGSLKDAKLEIIETFGEGLCNDCHALFNVVEFEGKCPRCGSQNKKILGGTDIRLMSITGL